MVSRAKSKGTRDTIIEAAVEVIATEGVHSATTRKIAAAADVNLGTLHYHFENKEAILLSILSHVTAIERTRLASRFNTDEKLHDRIERLLHFVWSEVQKDPKGQIALYALTLYALTTEGANWLASKTYDEYLALYRDVLRTASDVRSRKSSINVEDLGNFILSTFDGIVLQWLATRNTQRARREVMTLIRTAQHLAGG